MESKFDYNKKLLLDYKNYILNLPKLNFESAKELYEQIKLETDINVKENKMKKLIEGTLYIVCEFIEKSNFIYLISSDYDMDDIISLCNEVWIEKIKSGILDRASAYNSILSSTFINALNFKICEFNISIHENTILNSNNFGSVFSKCFDLYKNGFFDLESFNKILEDNEIYKPLIKEEQGYVALTYELILSIFETNIDFCMSKTKIDYLKHILVNNGIKNLIQNVDSSDIIDDDFDLDEIFDIKDLSSNLNYILNSKGFTYREREIIKLRFGFYGKQYMLEEVGKIFKISRERVRQIEAKALRKLRHPTRSEIIKDFVR